MKSKKKKNYEWFGWISLPSQGSMGHTTVTQGKILKCGCDTDMIMNDWKWKFKQIKFSSTTYVQSLQLVNSHNIK